MAEWETKVWCNVFCRLMHIDFIELFKGSDTLATRSFIDGDLDSDNTSPFMDFLDEQRAPIHYSPYRLYTIVSPNAYLADKIRQLFTDIGAGFHKRKWCSRHETRTIEFPYKHLYIHSTAPFWCLGKLTRYHQTFDLVGDCYWFIPGYQMVINGETIVLQAQSVIDHVHQASVPDPALSDKFPDHLTGTYVVFRSMLDTAALDDNGDWLVRTLKEAEVEALKEVAHALSQVISPVVVLRPD